MRACLISSRASSSHAAGALVAVCLSVLYSYGNDHIRLFEMPYGMGNDKQKGMVLGCDNHPTENLR